MPASLRRPHPNPRGRRRGDIGRGLGAVAVLALLIAGLPALVTHFAGLPDLSRPTGWAEVEQLLTGPDTGRLLAAVLAAVFWLAWSAFVALVLLETVALIGRRQPLRLPAFGPMQELVRTLVACVALLSVPATVSLTNPPAAPPTLAAALTPAAAGQPAADHYGTAAGSKPRRSAPRAAAQKVAATHAASRPASSGPTYEVLAMHNGQRDTLWRIAEQHLRDPLRWPEIFQLNVGRPQPDGATLTDPHWIRPGWLLLPADATGLPAPPTTGSPPAPRPATAAQPTPASPVAPAPPVGQHRQTPPAPIPPTTAVPDRASPAEAASGASAAGRAPSRDDPLPTGASHSASAPSTHGGRAPDPTLRTQDAADGVQQTLVATSLAGGLAAALVINRQRRRRVYRPRPPQPFAVKPQRRHCPPRYAASPPPTTPGQTTTITTTPTGRQRPPAQWKRLAIP